jgi:signal transduction histidine kinase
MTYWEASARVKLQRTAAELFEMQKQKEQLYEDEQRSRLAAEQANTAKDEFIAIISHELKTPLNAIAGWTRILKTHDISESTRETALVKIDKNLRAQAGLVEQLLTYSDIISESVNIEAEQVSIGELIDEIIVEVAPVAKEKDIEMVSRNNLNGETIGGDGERLKIALLSIFTNALKFTQPGGRIETDLSKTDDAICLIVKDNGRGIPVEFMPYIFEQYKQADTPNIRDYGGLGLGLTISKHIVKLHGGTIDAESEGKGKGSKFLITFPLRKTS